MPGAVMRMNKIDFAIAIDLPPQWVERGLYPDDFFEAQYTEYLSDGCPVDACREGVVAGAEHYRNGLYWYWISRDLEKAVLLEMIGLEPDEKMKAWLLKKVDEDK